MGLLNRLFKSERRIIKEVIFDEERIINIWRMHLASYEERDNLSKFFKVNKIDEAVNNLDALSDVLDKIKDTLDADLIDIGGEERLEGEVIKDIEAFLSFDKRLESNLLVQKIRDQKDIDKKTINELLKKVYQMLNNELHAIKIIKDKITLLKELRGRKFLEDNEVNQKEELSDEIKRILKGLFLTICHLEPSIYPALSQKCLSKDHFEEVDRAIRAVFLDREFRKNEIDTNEFFIDALRKLFANFNKVDMGFWSRLPEYIFDELLEQINEGAPFGEDFDRLFPIFEEKIYDDSFLDQMIGKFSENKIREFVMKQHPEWSVIEQMNAVRQIIKNIREAFKSAYADGHFEDLEGDMVR
jgi:hypothetical protein